MITTKAIGVKLPIPIHDELHDLAKRRGTTRNALLKEAVTALLAAQSASAGAQSA